MSEEIQEAREREGDFTNSVTAPTPVEGKAKGKGKGLKKKGPLILIVGLLLIFGVLIFASQTMMPFAVVNRLIEEFNTNGISSVLRSDNLLDLQLSMSDQNFGLTSYQVSALEEAGFTVGTYNGTKTLTYKKLNGKYQTVASTAVDAGSQPAESVRSSLPDGANAVFMSPAVINVTEAFKDSEFKTAYTTASKTWRGGNSGWFDAIADLSESVHGYKRSRWYKYAANSVSSTFNSLARSMIDEVGNYSSEAIDGTMDEGSHVDPDTGETVEDVSSAHSRTRAGLDVAAKITNVAKVGTDITCTAVEALMSVQTLATTYMRLQKLNLVSGYMEAVQKVQAGDGNESPMNDYNNRLTTNDSETKKNAIESAGMNALFNGTKINTSSDESVQSVNSENILFSENNSELGLISQAVSSAVSGGVNLVKAFTICNYAKGTLSFASAAITATSLALAIAAGPVGWAAAIGAITIKAVVKAVVMGLASALVSILVPYVIKKVGKALVDDMATEWLGEDLGNALVSGGNSLLSANHQTGGGSPASKAELGYFKKQQEAVIAAEAEYQRQIRSPFDISSQYTFLGSIVYNLTPMANSSGVGSVVKNMGNLVKSSVTTLLPSASAIAETEMIGMAEVGDCPLLESVGIQGDPYCNPLYITDTSTATVANYENIWNDPAQTDSVVATAGMYYGNIAYATPDEVAKWEEDHGNITTVGTDSTTGAKKYKITEGSNLQKYSLYCGQRASSWGIADANILESLRGQSSAAGGLLSLVPVLGDVISMINSIHDNKNQVWATGEICVASEENEYWCEMSIHQRFIEDERLRNDMGETDKDALTAYYDEYYENNPLDNSFEGILARYSGMTKDDVIATLDLIDALDYIANYDPSTRLAFGGIADESEPIFFEETENSPASEIASRFASGVTSFALEPKFVTFFDLRSRVATV